MRTLCILVFLLAASTSQCREFGDRTLRALCSGNYDTVTITAGTPETITAQSGSLSYCGITFQAAENEKINVQCSKVDLPTNFVIAISTPDTNAVEYSAPFTYASGKNSVYFDIYSYEDNAASLTGTFECEATIEGSSPATTQAPVTTQPPVTTKAPVTTQAPVTTTKSPTSSNGCKCGVVNEDKIVGGTNANEGEFPWQVRLNVGGYLCGGSLATSTKIITAAHCKPEVGHTAFLGDYNSEVAESYTITRNIKGVVVHPDYNKTANLDNDIAVLTIDEVPFSSKISPICFPSSSSFNYYDGKTVTATGWGSANTGGQDPTILQKVDVQVITNERCQSLYQNDQITSKMMCAMVENGGKDACQGDSGGPLLYKNPSDNAYEIAGVVSWGRGCAVANQPGVYARMTSLESWVKANLDGTQLCPRP